MAPKKPAALPDLLRYLQPFANALAKLRPEQLNEDVDASRLEAALRKRVRGLDAAAAEAELAKDREQLERWLKSHSDHPAHWILGFLMSPDLAEHLRQPAEPTPRGLTILFDAPGGWNAKAAPSCLNLKAGKILGSIIAIEELSFELLQRQFDHGATVQQPGVETTTQVSELVFDECCGKKYLTRVSAPGPWKQVTYVLRVPGGYVSITLATMTGAEFDELAFESKLHTLRLSRSV